jgi:hypothetical protein
MCLTAGKQSQLQPGTKNNNNNNNNNNNVAIAILL